MFEDNSYNAEGVRTEGDGAAVKISVVVPVYNAASTLEYTVGSILSPSFFGSCELILVDDGSTDGSAELCDRLAGIDRRIRVIHKKNRGVSSTRNEGIAAASGEFVTFVDSDDLLPKDCLETWLGALSGCGTDLLVGGYRCSGASSCAQAPGEDRLYGRDELGQFIEDNLADNGSYLRPVWGKLFRKSLIDSAKLRFEPGLNYGEDVLFLFRFILSCDSVRTLPNCVYIYRTGSEGLSADLSSDRHIMQLMFLLEPYSAVLLEMGERFRTSGKAVSLYHRDLVGRLICRILTVFATRRTALCNADNISRIYHYMKKDRLLTRPGGVFSLRKGQIPNLLLFCIGSSRLSASFYRLSSSVCGMLGIHPRRY